jgi:disulfide oxidoreductase YuzD
LVLRTKAATDTAKKLEMTLEETFGNPNFRDIKNKKKQGTHTEKTKKTEQLKNEAKRINRLRLEKRLQSNMENFVTRSVMDPELVFRAPEDFEDEDCVDWPIPVKWSSKDPRSQRHDNNDGEFDPDLVLLYSLERINLPSGKNMFTWLVRQAVVQRYFVSLFWMVKVKFFEPDSDAVNESFLLKSMSGDFRRIVTLLAQRAHAEHEKDFAYRYLPFILANALFFSFFYLWYVVFPLPILG